MFGPVAPWRLFVHPPVCPLPPLPLLPLDPSGGGAADPEAKPLSRRRQDALVFPGVGFVAPVEGSASVVLRQNMCTVDVVWRCWLGSVWLLPRPRAAIALSRPLAPLKEYKQWVVSVVDKSIKGGVVDQLGLYSSGWRVGHTLCCQWPSMKGAQSSDVFFYHAGSGTGRSLFELCKVNAMSYHSSLASPSAALWAVFALAPSSRAPCGLGEERWASCQCASQLRVSVRLPNSLSAAPSASASEIARGSGAGNARARGQLRAVTGSAVVMLPVCLGRWFRWLAPWRPWADLVALSRLGLTAEVRIIMVANFQSMCKGVIREWLPRAVDSDFVKVSRGKKFLGAIIEQLLFLVDMECQTALECLWLEGVQVEVDKAVADCEQKFKRKRSLKAPPWSAIRAETSFAMSGEVPIFSAVASSRPIVSVLVDFASCSRISMFFDVGFDVYCTCIFFVISRYIGHLQAALWIQTLPCQPGARERPRRQRRQQEEQEVGGLL